MQQQLTVGNLVLGCYQPQSKSPQTTVAKRTETGSHMPVYLTDDEVDELISALQRMKETRGMVE